MSENKPLGDLPHLLIETEAGKEFWSYMNNNYGSSVWGRVEDGILAVEAEMRERLAEAWDEGFDAGIDHALFKDFVFNPYSIKSERAQKYIEKTLSEDT